MQPISPQFETPVARIDVQGLSLAYRDSDPTGTQDRTILCVHGNPTWSYYYRGVFQRLQTHYRVVAVDHIGCGMSDKPNASDFAYRLSNHQENVRTLVERLDLSEIHLLAHDWGGAIGLGALVELRPRFRSITLLNTGAFPPPYLPLRIAACRIPVIGSLGVRGLNLFARAAITMAMSRRNMDPMVARNLLKPYDNWKNRVAIDAFVKDIPMNPSHPTYEDLAALERSLPSLADMPSLLVWGMKDWCFRPECLTRFQNVWPNARTVAIDDAGHYVLEDAADEVLDAIEAFLGECDG